MTFLQPILLAALPLVALPIVIHLINRQRHRTIPWGAMMFLLDAKRMTRGIARLRYWLIMAMRMLAIAALIFAVARPLASGRVGLALGGAPDTTIIVLDRSASMQQQDIETGVTKQTAALQKLAGLLRTLGQSPHVVLVESVANRAITVEMPDALLQMAAAAPTDTAADLPAMLETVHDYIIANQSGRTDVWICSDMQAADWQLDDGRWRGLRDGFAPLEGVRFYILAYPETAAENLAVRVEKTRIGLADQQTQLVLDVVLRRSVADVNPVRVPIEFVINGARSVVNVEMTDIEYRLQGHTIALSGESRSGWGYVELPADANLHDNRFYFVFGDPPERHTVIVSSDAGVANAMRIAATAPVDPTLSYSATIFAPTQLETIPWQKASLVLWQAPLPENDIAQQLSQFVESGRPVLFFPPAQPSNTAWSGVRWGQWRTSAEDEPLRLQTWRGDSDLLQHTQSGVPLPLGKLRVYRHCTIEGKGQPLATLGNGVTLLQRGTLGRGSFYFCATLPRLADSTLLQDGVSFYVILHRALATGAATRGKVRQLAAGSEAAREIAPWKLLSAAPAEALSLDRSSFAATFQNDDRLVALNRPASEDRAERLNTQQVDELFHGLHYRTVEEEIGSATALASEVWRVFVFLMAVALIIEAALCLPERKITYGTTTVGHMEPHDSTTSARFTDAERV